VAERVVSDVAEPLSLLKAALAVAGTQRSDGTLVFGVADKITIAIPP
jgi:hypothetical protein